MDLDELGFFLFMEEQERKEKEQQEEKDDGTITQNVILKSCKTRTVIKKKRDTSKKLVTRYLGNF